MTAASAPAPRLTLADRDTILCRGACVRPDPDALLSAAHDEHDRFSRGGYVDAAGCRTYLKAHGRRFVNRLIERGYPGTVVMRMAIQSEGQP